MNPAYKEGRVRYKAAMERLGNCSQKLIKVKIERVTSSPYVPQQPAKKKLIPIREKAPPPQLM